MGGRITFQAGVGLCVCRGYSLVVASRFLIALASLVAEHKLYVVQVSVAAACGL